MNEEAKGNDMSSKDGRVEAYRVESYSAIGATWSREQEMNDFLLIFILNRATRSVLFLYEEFNIKLAKCIELLNVFLNVCVCAPSRDIKWKVIIVIMIMIKIICYLVYKLGLLYHQVSE